MGAPHGDKDSHITPALSNSSSYFLIINYSQGLYLYIDFLISSAPSTSGILCISPSFQLAGAHVGNIPGNTSQYLYNTVCNDTLFFSSTFSKCAMRRSLSFWKGFVSNNTSYKKNTRLPDVLIFFLVHYLAATNMQFRNSYYTSITLIGILFQMHFICIESVTLIVSLMYNVHGASRRWTRFCLCLPSVVIHNKTYVHSQLFGYIQMENYK